MFHNKEEAIVFDANNENEAVKDQEVKEVINEDGGDKDYENSDKEDISLEADEEEEPNPILRQTEQVRVPNPRYQHLQTSDDRTEEYIPLRTRILLR